jgi:hypothetical protein
VFTIEEDRYHNNEDRLWNWQESACKQRCCALHHWFPAGGDTAPRLSDTGHDASLGKLGQN